MAKGSLRKEKRHQELLIELRAIREKLDRIGNALDIANRVEPSSEWYPDPHRVEREYRMVFSPLPVPYEGQYSNEESLEQPSALRYVPSTMRTMAEMAPDTQLRLDAKLVRDF